MKKLIFDFDGTLVDSMRQWAGKMLNVLSAYGVDYPDDIIKTVTPLGDRGTAEYFIRTFKIAATPDELIVLMDEYAMKEYTYNISAKETVVDTLKELKKLGYSLNVLTASPHRMLDVCLKRNGIYDIFDNVWSCDDFNTTKSDVNIYYAVAERLVTTVDNCVFLDDNINAVTVGKQSGMRVVGVYDDSSSDMVEEIKAASDAYLYKMEELPVLLKTI